MLNSLRDLPSRDTIHHSDHRAFSTNEHVRPSKAKTEGSHGDVRQSTATTSQAQFDLRPSRRARGQRSGFDLPRHARSIGSAPSIACARSFPRHALDRRPLRRRARDKDRGPMSCAAECDTVLIASTVRRAANPIVPRRSLLGYCRGKSESDIEIHLASRIACEIDPVD